MVRKVVCAKRLDNNQSIALIIIAKLTLNFFFLVHEVVRQLIGVFYLSVYLCQRWSHRKTGLVTLGYG